MEAEDSGQRRVREAKPALLTDGHPEMHGGLPHHHRGPQGEAWGEALKESPEMMASRLEDTLVHEAVVRGLDVMDYMYSLKGGAAS
ncbi:unnamed protein product, partial [Discosporangium mesarthrocarpum]